MILQKDIALIGMMLMAPMAEFFLEIRLQHMVLQLRVSGQQQNF
jgi:hypothetical protein